MHRLERVQFQVTHVGDGSIVPSFINGPGTKDATRSKYSELELESSRQSWVWTGCLIRTVHAEYYQDSWSRDNELIISNTS